MATAGVASGLKVKPTGNVEARTPDWHMDVYHFKLIGTSLVGFSGHLKQDGVCKDDRIELQNSGMEKTEVLPVLQVGYGDQVFDTEVDGGTIYRDDLVGHILGPKLVEAAPIDRPGPPTD